MRAVAPDEWPDYHRLILAMDAAYLEHAYESMKQKRQGRMSG